MTSLKKYKHLLQGSSQGVHDTHCFSSSAALVAAGSILQATAATAMYDGYLTLDKPIVLSISPHKTETYCRRDTQAHNSPRKETELFCMLGLRDLCFTTTYEPT